MIGSLLKPHWTARENASSILILITFEATREDSLLFIENKSTSPASACLNDHKTALIQELYDFYMRIPRRADRCSQRISEKVSYKCLLSN